MSRTLIASLVFLVLSTVLIPQSTAAETAKDPRPFGGRLWKSLLGNRSGQILASHEDSSACAALPPDTRKRLADCSDRFNRFRSRLGNPPDSSQFERTVLYNNRVAIERGIVALVPKPGIEDEALMFLNVARIYYEWEGMSDGPLTEAEVAAGYLSAHPETPVKPYLYLFLLHRYRSAYECQIMEKDVAGAKKTAALYRAILARARAQTDPLAVLAADDLDLEPGNVFLDTEYTGGPVRP